MPSLFQYPFFQALGFAIINSIWQMALIWLVFIVLNIFFKPKAFNKYRIAVTIQLLGFIWFLLTLQFYYTTCAEAFTSSAASFIIPDQGNSFQSFLFHAIIKAEQFLPVLSIAYLLLLIILITKWLINYNITQSVCSKGLSKINFEWSVFVQQTAAQLNIRRKICIHISSFINSPLTIGFIKPLILIPLASINCLSTEQMEAVLLHELAHIKRQDYLLNLILSVVEIILFFNPFTQLISKTIQRERENACDDWVLQFQYNPAVYAEALLQIAALSKTSSPVLSMAAAKNGDLLLSRVKRMIYKKEQHFNYRNQLLLLLLITVIVGSVAWLHPASFNNTTNIPPQKTIASKKQIILEPLAAKVDNPLFNPIFFLKKPLQKEVEKSIHQIIKDSALATQLISNANNALTTAMPLVEKEVASTNLNNIQKLISEQFKNIETQSLLSAAKLKNDSAAKRSSFKIIDDQFLNKLSKIGTDLNKMKAEIDDEMNNEVITSMKESKWQEEINQAVNEIQLAGIPVITKLKKLENDIKEKTSAAKNQQLALQKKILKDRFTKIAGTLHLTKQKLDSLNEMIVPDNFFRLSALSPETESQSVFYGVNNDEPITATALSYHTPKRSGIHQQDDSTAIKQIEIIIPDKKGNQRTIIIQIERE